DFKAGWILRVRRDRGHELEGRRQQLFAGLVGMAVSLVVVALAHQVYFANDMFPPIVKVFVATIEAGVDPQLIFTLLIWAVPGALIQLIGGSKRQMGILLATGLLIVNPLAGWAVIAGIIIRLIILRVGGESAESAMFTTAAGFIAGDALYSSFTSLWKAR